MKKAGWWLNADLALEDKNKKKARKKKKKKNLI